MKKIEGINRARATDIENRCLALARGLTAKAAGLSADVKARLDAAGIANIGGLQALALAGSDQDAAALLAAQQDSVNLLVLTIDNIRNLLAERVSPPRREPPPSRPITPEEAAERTSDKYLIATLTKDTTLPAEVREIMLRALRRGLPVEHRELIAAYYASFLPEPKEATP